MVGTVILMVLMALPMALFLGFGVIELIKDPINWQKPDRGYDGPGDFPTNDYTAR